MIISHYEVLIAANARMIEFIYNSKQVNKNNTN